MSATVDVEKMSMTVRKAGAHRVRRVVVVGGVAAGMSAAARLRRNDETLEIVVLERGGHVSFANCGLPYHLSGVIPERDDLLLMSPESLGARFALDVRVRHEVLAIDRAQRRLAVREANTDQVRYESYDALILATGAAPIRPDIPGNERMHSLRDLADLDGIVAALNSSASDRARSAAIIGGGFIGLELAENLTRAGLGVTIVELGEQVLAPLDPEMASTVLDQLECAGVQVRLGVSAVGVAAYKLELSDGTTVPADLTVAAIGASPESGLARAAGLRVSDRGGIVVDDEQLTSDPHIYAVGDVAQKQDAISGLPTLVALAQTANRHGRLVADVITGRRVLALPVLGTAIVEIFGLTVAMTGWNEKRLRAAGRGIRVIHSHPASHVGYYPGAEPMSLKLLVDAETDAILGAQAVGGHGVDKRIDVIATAMRGGLTGSDLAELELSYAPQFGAAKDPVNMLGMIADNLRSGAEITVQWHELDERIRAGAALVDVRCAAEFLAGAIPGAMNVPLELLRERIHDVPTGPVVVYCEVGQRGHTAARMLRQLGRDVVNLDGGYRTWSAAQGQKVAH